MVFVLVVVASALLAVCVWWRQGYRLAVAYTAESGHSANGWSPATWAMLWMLSPLIAGPIFDRATNGYASDESAVYRRLVRFRPSWLMRAFIIVVGLVVGLGSLPVVFGSFANGQLVPGVVASVVAVVFLGAAGAMLWMRPKR